MNRSAEKKPKYNLQIAAKNVARKSACQFIDKRAEAVTQQKLQQAAANSPQTVQLQSFQAMADNSAQSLKALPQSSGVNMAPLQLKHDVFNKKNMIFATNDPDRIPSFYFSTDGKDSWRVRQQHGRGPMTERKGSNVQHYFFESEEKARNFYDAAVANKPEEAQKVKHSITPHLNDAHVEYPIGNITSAHISGGKIIPPGSFNYTDDDYEKMAASVDAWKAEEKENPDFNLNKDRKMYANVTVDNALQAPE
ncbi:MAG: hypothetical protein P8X89_23005 [Reinekea sp.]